MHRGYNSGYRKIGLLVIGAIREKKSSDGLNLILLHDTRLFYAETWTFYKFSAVFGFSRYALNLKYLIYSAGNLLFLPYSTGIVSVVSSYLYSLSGHCSVAYTEPLKNRQYNVLLRIEVCWFRTFVII